MTRFLLHPYRPDSAGAKRLMDALGATLYNSRGRSLAEDVVINWGDGNNRLPTTALNKDIVTVINKIDFFVRLRDTDFIPDFRTTRAGAESLPFPVFCRTTVEGRDGEGIVVAQNVTGLVPAPLYVEFKPKTAEYRVHIGRLHDGTVRIIGSQKKTFEGVGDVWAGDQAHLSEEWDTAPPAVTTCAIGAFQKFPQLSFVGFDVIYNSATDTAYVLEGNTAPMVTPQTAKRYSSFFREWAERRFGKKAPQTPTEPQPILDQAELPATASRPSVTPSRQPEADMPFTVSVSLTRAEVLSQLRADIATGKIKKEDLVELMKVIVNAV